MKDDAILEVQRAAKLARIELSPEELPQYAGYLHRFLEHVSKLKELDVDGVDPRITPVDLRDASREDVPRPSLPKTEALRNAPEKNDDYFIVPRVVEE